MQRWLWNMIVNGSRAIPISHGFQVCDGGIRLAAGIHRSGEGSYKAPGLFVRRRVRPRRRGGNKPLPHPVIARGPLALWMEGCFEHGILFQPPINRPPSGLSRIFGEDLFVFLETI